MDEKLISRYVSNLQENIFLTMELGKQQYSSIMEMPVKRLELYVQWKLKLDEDIAKAKADKLG